MGLDTSHNCWHGPYSSFGRFRRCLGEQIGINLDEYLGYNQNGTKYLDSIEHDIKPLLNHSDCDGSLTVKESRQIAKGLTQILKNFNEELPSDYNFKEKIIQFRDGCLDAVSKKQKVKFQ